MTFLEFLALLKKRLALMIILPIVFAGATAAFAWLVMPNTYTASIDLYVLTRADDQIDLLTNTDLTASQMLTNDIAKLAQSDRVESETASALGMRSLTGYDIAVESSTNTRVLTLTVSGEEASAAATIANQMAVVVDKVAQEVMDVRSVNTIGSATEPEYPSGPARVQYTAVAFLLGLLVAASIAVLTDLLDTRVRTTDELEEMLGVPVIGRIPVIK